MAPSTTSLASSPSPEIEEENLFAIIALVSLFVIFSVYCCWGSSCCGKLLAVIKACRQGRSERAGNAADEAQSTSPSPTIILLPYGRILVVDGTVFARFHVDNTGLDLFELGDRVLRSERSTMHRAPSFVELDSEDDEKDATSSAQRSSPLPPTYESIFGENQLSTPPPYSDACGTAAAVTVDGANMESAL